jgi:hypothetical protein
MRRHWANVSTTTTPAASQHQPRRFGHRPVAGLDCLPRIH